MTGAPQPRMHGSTHCLGGSDPIPCLADVISTTGFNDKVIELGATSTLLGYWRLGETASPFADTNPYLSACDASQVADTTALTPHVAGGLSAAQDDGAVQFNGGAPPSYPAGDYLQVSTTGGCGTRYQLNSSANFSVAFWMNAPSTGGVGIGGLVGCEATGTSTGFGWWFWFDHGFVATDTLKFERRQDGGLSQDTLAVLTLDEWHFVVGTYSSSAGMNLYIDGALVDTDATTFNTGAPSAGATRFGNIGSGGQPYNGTLDEVSIWGSVLTLEQIVELYLAADVTSATTPIGPAGGVLTGSYPDPGLADGVVTESKLALSDVTTANASTSKHGFLKKLDNNSTHFMDGQGNWSTPSGTGAVATDAIWDAKGDLAVASGSDAADNLAVGSDGQVLTADSTQTLGVKWAAAGGGGAWTLLHNLVRATDGVFDQSSISGSYNDLFLQLIIRSDRSATFDQISLEFNGDTSSSHYAWQNANFFGTSSSITANGASAVDHIQVGDTIANNGTANYFAMYEIWIPGYASTNWIKIINAKGTAANSTGSNGIENFIASGLWNQTSAITRIQIFPTNGTNWKTNSVCRIYGIT